MSRLTRKEHAEAIMSQLRALGPQSVEEIREDLGLTKREAEDALWLLGATARVEYATTFPLTYKVTSS